jgi:hypothetical protein
MKMIDFDEKVDLKDRSRHGGPYDRGSADSYYGRGLDPHWWPMGTGRGLKIDLKEGEEGYDEYMEGFKDNQDAGNFKDWG